VLAGSDNELLEPSLGAESAYWPASEPDLSFHTTLMDLQHKKLAAFWAVAGSIKFWIST
jgi:hypothetical protein